jgi:hypothetical protein
MSCLRQPTEVREWPLCGEEFSDTKFCFWLLRTQKDGAVSRPPEVHSAQWWLVEAIYQLR